MRSLILDCCDPSSESSPESLDASAVSSTYLHDLRLLGVAITVKVVVFCRLSGTVASHEQYSVNGIFKINVKILDSGENPQRMAGNLICYYVHTDTTVPAKLTNTGPSFVGLVANPELYSEMSI